MSLLRALRKNRILPWMVAGFALGLLVALLLILSGVFTRRGWQATSVPTPALTIIIAPSMTPTSRPSATPETILSTATPTQLPVALGEIGPGQLVEIFGTGGDNLRLRSRPGLESAIAFLGVEREVFEVVEGPEEVDGYMWWYLRNPYNTEKNGWAVSVYLRPIVAP